MRPKYIPLTLIIKNIVFLITIWPCIYKVYSRLFRKEKNHFVFRYHNWSANYVKVDRENVLESAMAQLSQNFPIDSLSVTFEGEEGEHIHTRL